MNNKRLVKGNDRKIAGVCSGVANYFGWDPIWVRIGWAVLTFAYGVGLVAYIVCAIVMPNDDNNDVVAKNVILTSEGSSFDVYMLYLLYHIR